MAAGILHAAAQESGQPAAGTPAVPKLPASPSELFAALARDSRPQWRPYFRETVPHAASDRYKAALALGAVCADCYLAAEARDAQQIRNLLTDMTSLEMMLSIARQMSSLRQKPAELAEAGDWPGVRQEIATLMANHAQFLSDQKDEDLAELERIGCWLRAFHVGARFAARFPQPPVKPCIWSGALVVSLRDRAAKLGARNDAKTIHCLLSGLDRLAKAWPGETTAANAAERLAASIPILESMMTELIDGAPTAPQPSRPQP